MKLKKIKTLVLVICSICIFYSVLPKYNAFAEEDNNIIIEGNEGGLITIPDKDEFLVKENMLPGDTVKGEILLQNKYDYPYEIYIRAEDREKKSDVNFLNKLILNINSGEKSIYSGNLTGGEKMSQDIYLGTINPGESITLNASVILDGKSTGNEFKNKYASIDWIFTASRTETLGDKEIDEPNKPNTDSGVLGAIEEMVKTGDSVLKIIVSFAVLMTSALVIVKLGVKRRRLDG